MVNLKTGQIVPIPIHSKDVSVGLIREIIRQVGISRKRWIEL
jgi:predicted RNA binding protein YcfA (HicA-like mRNA interferase family)